LANRSPKHPPPAEPLFGVLSGIVGIVGRRWANVAQPAFRHCHLSTFPSVYLPTQNRLPTLQPGMRQRSYVAASVVDVISEPSALLADELRPERR
jgi:hypothetical protein